MSQRKASLFRPPQPSSSNTRAAGLVGPLDETNGANDPSLLPSQLQQSIVAAYTKAQQTMANYGLDWIGLDGRGMKGINELTMLLAAHFRAVCTYIRTTQQTQPAKKMRKKILGKIVRTAAVHTHVVCGKILLSKPRTAGRPHLHPPWRQDCSRPRRKNFSTKRFIGHTNLRAERGPSPCLSSRTNGDE